MEFDPTAWQRYECDGTPVYVRDCLPGWFVPNETGDRIIGDLKAGAISAEDYDTARFLARLPKGGKSDWDGRAKHLAKPKLRDLWMHLTDHCNMACKHCLFSSSPSAKPKLPLERALLRIGEAPGMGCRVFARTGGERFHLQLSLDGLQPRHDAIRGAGTYQRLAEEVEALNRIGFPFTISMCVDASNVGDMPAIVEAAAELGATNLHFMWLFVRGRAGEERFAPPATIFENLKAAQERAEELGIGIDNLDAIKTQVFALAGTVHDGTTSGGDRPRRQALPVGGTDRHARAGHCHPWRASRRLVFQRSTREYPREQCPQDRVAPALFDRRRRPVLLADIHGFEARLFRCRESYLSWTGALDHDRGGPPPIRGHPGVHKPGRGLAPGRRDRHSRRIRISHQPRLGQHLFLWA